MNDVEVRREQGRALTAAEFVKFADIPPEIEWFANLRNPNTRKAYENDLREFRRFLGIARPENFRTVTRAHVIAWRKDLERRLCAPTTIQRKLAALSSLFEYLTEQNAVFHNPVDGVKRPKSNRQEGNVMQLSNEAFGITEEPHLACVRADFPWELPSGAVPRGIGFAEVMEGRQGLF